MKKARDFQAYSVRAIPIIFVVLLISCSFRISTKHLYPVGVRRTSMNRARHLEYGKGTKSSELFAPKRIVQWTPVFGLYNRPGTFADCPGLHNRCFFDRNRSNVAAADAVTFHGPDIFKSSDLPSAQDRSHKQRYVFMTMESPESTFAQYKIKYESTILQHNYYNWTMTPLFSSDVLAKYGGFWLSPEEAKKKGIQAANSHYVFNASSFMNKIPSIFALISNCETSSKREAALKEINKHFNVTIAGSCALDPKMKKLCPKNEDVKCEEEAINKYAFFFSGENAACRDYVTEKYWTRINLSSILIILKRSDYMNVNMPPHSVIALDDFESPQAMSKYLEYLVKNETAYSEYFDWRTQGWTIAPWNAQGYRNGYCRLCEKLWEPNLEDKVIPDVKAWYEQESSCDNKFVTQWAFRDA